MAKAGHVQQALSLIEAANPPARSELRSGVVKALLHSRIPPLDLLLTIAREIDDKRIRAETLGALGAVLASAKDIRTDQVFTEALSAARGLPLDTWDGIAPVTLSGVAVAIAQSDPTRAEMVFDEALVMLRFMPDRPIKPDVAKYSRDHARQEVIVNQAKAGRIEQALELVASLEESNHISDARYAIGLAMTHAGQFEHALEFASAFTDLSSRANLHANISKALMRDGFSEKALSLAQSIGDDYPRRKTLRWFANTYIAQGKVSRALRILEVKDMAEYIRVIIDWVNDGYLPIRALREMVGVVRWAWPTWQPIYEIMSVPESGD